MSLRYQAGNITRSTKYAEKFGAMSVLGWVACHSAKGDRDMQQKYSVFLLLCKTKISIKINI